MYLGNVGESLRSKHTPADFIVLVRATLSQEFLPIGFHSFNMSHLLFYRILLVKRFSVFPFWWSFLGKHGKWDHKYFSVYCTGNSKPGGWPYKSLTSWISWCLFYYWRNWGLRFIYFLQKSLLVSGEPALIYRFIWPDTLKNNYQIYYFFFHPEFYTERHYLETSMSDRKTAMCLPVWYVLFGVRGHIIIHFLTHNIIKKLIE